MDDMTGPEPREPASSDDLADAGTSLVDKEHEPELAAFLERASGVLRAGPDELTARRHLMQMGAASAPAQTHGGRWLRVASVAAAASIAVFATLAGFGALPAPAQEVLSDVASRIGLEIPHPAGAARSAPGIDVAKQLMRPELVPGRVGGPDRSEHPSLVAPRRDPDFVPPGRSGDRREPGPGNTRGSEAPGQSGSRGPGVAPGQSEAPGQSDEVPGHSDERDVPGRPEGAPTGQADPDPPPGQSQQPPAREPERGPTSQAPVPPPVQPDEPRIPPAPGRDADVPGQPDDPRAGGQDSNQGQGSSQDPSGGTSNASDGGNAEPGSDRGPESDSLGKPDAPLGRR